MDKVLTILLMIIVILLIVAIQIYLNLDKHRFRMLQQWKHMTPGILDWVDTADEIFKRLDPAPEKAGSIAQDIEKYRASKKKPFVQIDAVNSISDQLVKLLVPGCRADPVLSELLDTFEDIENDLHSPVYSFNISVGMVNKQLERPLFNPVGKLFRFRRAEKLRVGRD